MYYSLGPGAKLYRVTGPGLAWPNPLSGLGAYYTKGGRFNNGTQQTVYCAEDPLAAIAEAAFYAALDWQTRISRHIFNAVVYPFITKHKLWCFELNPPPTIIDLEDDQAVRLFRHNHQMLLNPSLSPADTLHQVGEPLERDYWGTQHLADDIRKHMIGPRIEGLKAPAIRLDSGPGYRAHQLALFVFSDTIHTPYKDRSTKLMECELELQFYQLNPRQEVNSNTISIDWRRPKFRICGRGANSLVAYPGNPSSRSYSPNRWYDIEIKFV